MSCGTESGKVESQSGKYRWGLRAKSYLLSGVIALFILGIVVAFLRREHSVVVGDAIRNRVEVAESLGVSCTNTLMYKELGLVREGGLLDNYISEMMAKKNLGIQYIIVTDEKNRVIAHNDPKEYGKVYTDIIAKQAYQATSTIAQPVGYREENLEVATPLAIASTRWGTLRMGFSMESMQKNLRALYWEAALIGMGILAFHFLMVSVLIRKITRPILHMRDVLRKVASGNMAIRSEVKSQDEIGFLSQTINTMMDRLNEARQEIEKAHQSLVQTEKMAAMGKLTAGLAHEINNPLGGVFTCVEMLKQNPGDFAARDKYLKLMDMGLERIRRIVKQLLDFSKQRPFEPQPTDVNPLLEKTLEMTHYQLSHYRIELTKDLSPDLPEIKADSHQLMQVFVNLILNSVQAMPEGGNLLIRTWRENGRVAIAIRDNGCGIPKEIQGKIFDPFFTTKETGQGTGLGLSVSYGIIQNHGGEIKVESEEGKGAEFTVFLPV